MSDIAAKLRIATSAALALVCTSRAFADEILLFGSVGKSPVMMSVEHNGSQLEGWFLYLREAQQIEIKGDASADGKFVLQEMAAGKVAATFKGTMQNASWTGIWRKSDTGASARFSLAADRNLLSNLSASIDCTAHQTYKQFAITMSHEFALRIANGNLSKLETTRTTRSPDGDEQTCSIGASDLVRQPSDIGILLRSKKDHARDASEPHCTIRIVGNDRYLYVFMGDPGEANDDCRRAADMMYCTPRAFWSDMVIDRKSGLCKSVE